MIRILQQYSMIRIQQQYSMIRIQQQYSMIGIEQQYSKPTTRPKKLSIHTSSIRKLH